MLKIELVSAAETPKAAQIFHRDGFVAIKDALTPEQLAFAGAGAQRVIEQQTEATALENANRGFARYSFGDQMRHPEWQMLIDLPTILPIIDEIWGGEGWVCMGGGGDYSIPGAKIQPLHSDIGEFLHDPWRQVTFHDVPTPFIVVNFLMTDFTKANGAIRFVPGTQRSRHAPPTLEDEPQWMKDSIICAPAGTAIIRDVRCWHAGTANTSQEIRPMTSIGYFASWFRGSTDTGLLPRDDYQRLSPRAQRLCRYIVADRESSLSPDTH